MTQHIYPSDAPKLAAIAGVLPSKVVSEAKKVLPDDSTHHVEFTVHLTASVQKSGPTVATPTASLLNAATVAFLAKKLGATRAHVERALNELAAAAIAGDGSIRDQIIESDDEMLIALNQFQQHVTDELPKVERPGRVKVIGSVQSDDLPMIQADNQDASTRDYVRLTASEPKLEINAAENAETAETGKLPTFDMVAYNGGTLRLGAFDAAVVADLAGMNIESQQRPVRLNHDANAGVGHTTSIRVENHRLLVAGTISRQTDAAKEIIASAKAGFPWQASIGARIDRLERIAAGQSVTVNGRSFEGPLLIARETTLGEVSFVDLGADTTTSARIAAADSDDPPDQKGVAGEGTGGAARRELRRLSDAGMSDEDIANALSRVNSNFSEDVSRSASVIGQISRNEIDNPPQSLVDALESIPTPVSNPDDANAAFGGIMPKQNDQTKPDADPNQIKGAGDIDHTLNQAASEQQRRERINAAAKNVLDDRPDLHADVGKIARNGIEAGWSAQQVELELMRLNRGHGGVSVRRDSKRSPDVITAALCLAGGLANIEKRFPEQTLDAAEREFSGGLGLGETMLMFAQSNGYRGHGTSQLQSLLQAAFSGGGPGGTIAAAGGHSTFDLPGILSNVANKFLREGFDSVDASWRGVSAVRSVANFHQHTTYTMVGDFMYDQVAATGELKHGKVDEVGYTNQAETYGKIFGISRKDLINDDLDALSGLPRRIGRGAALKLNLEFWKVFMDNAAFFTAARNNFADGANTALGIDGITKAEELFLDQLDPDGNPLGISPQVLVVPTGLKAPAESLMESPQIVTTGGSSKSKDPSNNPHRNKFTLIVSPYLNNANLTGNSNKAWYLLADPQTLPVIEVAFLNGRQQPTVESADADFNTLGIQMRGWHDFGIAKQEHRGGVKLKGEA